MYRMPKLRIVVAMTMVYFNGKPFNVTIKL